jgi:sugar lactone lactonase YvrE
LFLAERDSRRIHSFALRADGLAAAGRIHCELLNYGDGPYDMVFDDHGNLYVACGGAGKVLVLDAWGSVTKEIIVDGADPVALAFCGKALKTLAIGEVTTGSVYSYKNDYAGSP